jgi:hypothetical protein
MKRIIQVSLLLTGVLFCMPALAQSDDMSLGDLARNLRKNQAPPRTVIDNDNLSDVMEQGENKRWTSSSSRPSVERAAIQLVSGASPDVTCALSFSGQRDLLGSTLHPESLPDTELGKLDGPATILGDSLQISIHNGSDWDVREITVGFTLVHRQEPAYREIDGFRLLPATLNNPMSTEKNREITVLYHMKGTAAPAATTLFQAPLNISVGPDQEWHWAIVRAKGIPPAKSSEPSPAPGPAPVIEAPN